MLVSSHPPLFLFVLPLIFLIVYFHETTSHRWSDNGARKIFQTTNSTTSATSSPSSSPSASPTPSPSNESDVLPTERLQSAFEGGVKFVQVSMQYGDNYDVTIERALKTHIDYGKKWGYETQYLRQNIMPSDGIYNKLFFLLATMVNELAKPFGRRSEWLVWFDSDSVLVNDNIPWSIFIPPSERVFSEINMLVTQDWSGFNAGVFLIRVCEWSLQVLSDAIALPRLDPSVELPFAEQTALRVMFDKPERNRHRVYVPRYWFNVYDDRNAPEGEVTYPGSMLIHFPALGDTRYEAMGSFMDTLERNPAQLRIPLYNTSYPVETEAYWKRLGDAMNKLNQFEDYKNEVREKNKGIYEGHGDAFKKVNEAATVMSEVVLNSADDKQKVREKYLKFERELHFVKKNVNKLLKEAEEAQAKKEEEEKQAAERKESEAKAEAERKKKEEEEKKAVAEQEKKEAERKQQEEKEEEKAKAESENKGEQTAPSENNVQPT